LIQRRKERAKRRYPRQAGRINASGVRGRGVLENARAKKWRRNPDRIERRNLKWYGSRGRNHQRRSSSVMTTAGSDQRNRAFMK
jgi:hypothetical protein